MAASSPAKTFAVTLALVGGITAAIIAFVMWDSARTSARQTAEAALIGFTATPQTWSEGEDGDQEGHILTFSYLDGANAVHTRTMERITWYDPSSTYHVCYNPSDSTDWKLYRSSHECGS